MLIGVEAGQHVGAQERRDPVAPFSPVEPERDDGTGRERGILQRPVDLRLDERRLVLVRPAASRQEVELVTRPRGSMARPVSAGVDPERDSIRLPRPFDVADGVVLLPFIDRARAGPLFQPGERRQSAGGVEIRKRVKPSCF